MARMIALIGLLTIAAGQICSHSNNVGGGIWRNEDFPSNTTTQDFSVLFNRTQSWQNNYVYIPNTVPAGLDTYNTQWVTRTESQKLAQDPTVRPMGFKYGVVKPYNAEVPCVSIEGVQGFGVEIMVYALIDVEICVRDYYQAGSLNAQTTQLFNDVCGQQRLQHCFIGPDTYMSSSNDPRQGYMSYQIYIRGTQPVDYDVPVFYRSRKSEFSYRNQGSQFSSGNTEMWCMMISGTVDNTYPEFISVVPSNINIPPTNGANGLHSTFALLIVSACAALFARW